MKRVEDETPSEPGGELSPRILPRKSHANDLTSLEVKEKPDIPHAGMEEFRLGQRRNMMAEEVSDQLLRIPILGPNTTDFPRVSTLAKLEHSFSSSSYSLKSESLESHSSSSEE